MVDAITGEMPPLLAQCCPAGGGGRISGLVLMTGLLLAFALWQSVTWTKATWKSDATGASRRMYKLGLVVLLGGLLIGLIAHQAMIIAAPPADVITIQTSGIPKLVDLGSKSCAACKEMAPILDDLQREYAGQFDVEFIDVGLRENYGLAHDYRIRLIPTQILFDQHGRELWRHEGFLSKADIMAAWQRLGFEFKPDTNSPTSAAAVSSAMP